MVTVLQLYRQYTIQYRNVMMIKVILSLTLLSLISCSGTTMRNNVSNHTGWIDEDTYTVQITGADEEKAVDSAKHQILKDIVDVRVRNNSRYTDIVKIRDEFTVPLNNGVIISRHTTPEGLTINFQIREKGLKKKFQRQ
jgi:hypothetical protein